MPSDNPGTFNGANPDQYLFDGNGSFNGVDLYSFYSGPSSMPHHFTVDLGVKTDLRKVKLNMLDPSINSSNNITEVQIWGRDNLNFAETSSSDEIEFINASWQLLYEGNVDGLNEQTSSFIIPQASSLMRYIRVRVTESVGNDSAQFTELSFYGENTEPIELDRTRFTFLQSFAFAQSAKSCCPAIVANARVLSSHGQPFARAHCSTSRCPPSAAFVHVHSFQGQPFLRAHCSTPRCPPRAAYVHVSAFHGQLFSRNHFSTRNCPP